MDPPIRVACAFISRATFVCISHRPYSRLTSSSVALAAAVLQLRLPFQFLVLFVSGVGGLVASLMSSYMARAYR